MKDDKVPISDCAKKLLKKMLEVDPKKRIKIQEIRHNSWVLGEKE